MNFEITLELLINSLRFCTFCHSDIIFIFIYLRMIAHNRLKLEKHFKSLFIHSQLFVAQTQIIQRLHTGCIVFKSNRIQLSKELMGRYQNCTVFVTNSSTNIINITSAFSLYFQSMYLPCLFNIPSSIPYISQINKSCCII